MVKLCKISVASSFCIWNCRSFFSSISHKKKERDLWEVENEKGIIRYLDDRSLCRNLSPSGQRLYNPVTVSWISLSHFYQGFFSRPLVLVWFMLQEPKYSIKQLERHQSLFCALPTREKWQGQKVNRKVRKKKEFCYSRGLFHFKTFFWSFFSHYIVL